MNAKRLSEVAARMRQRAVECDNTSPAYVPSEFRFVARNLKAWADEIDAALAEPPLAWEESMGRPAPPCESCASGDQPEFLDQDGVLASLSKKPGIPMHARACPDWQRTATPPSPALTQAQRTALETAANAMEREAASVLATTYLRRCWKRDEATIRAMLAEAPKEGK